MKIIFSENILNYTSILLFFVIALALALIISVLPKIIASHRYNKGKLEAYECGFDPFGYARSKFDIKFYLIAMLFIIFDLEIAFLFPWSVVLKGYDTSFIFQSYGHHFIFYSMMSFLFFLTIGFIYEWKKGALDWD